MEKFYDDFIRPLIVFWKITGVSVSIYNDKGHMIRSIGTPCDFCRLINQEERIRGKCISSRIRAGEYSHELGDSYIYTCHAGLVVISLSLLKRSKPVGTIVAGPILLEEADSDVVEMVMTNCELPDDYNKLYADSLRNVPLIEPEKAYYCGQLLANLIYPAFGNSDSEVLERRRRITLQQELISEALLEQSNAETSRTEQSRKYRELADKIIAWDEEGADEILNSILGSIIFESGNDSEMVKIKTSEMIGVLISNLYRKGVSESSIFDSVSRYQEYMAASSDLGGISYGMHQLVKEFVDILKKSLGEDLSPIVLDSVKYIRRNYCEPVTLQEVSDHIGVSHAHLSRVFKEEMGQGFSDYINTFRLGKAKELLSESSMTLSEIAQSVGYSNQQYFTRVFKNQTGMTPGQYRNSN